MRWAISAWSEDWFVRSGRSGCCVDQGVDLTQPASRKRVIEQVLAAYSAEEGRDLDDLAGLMSRLADDAGREEARAVYWQDAAAA